MAEDDLLHTAELLKTALPYVDMKSRLTLELLVKLYELTICMRNFTNNDVSACGFENEKADMESLLNSIRPKCNENEQAFVDKMLNVFQAKKMFEMYNNYMEAMKAMEGFEGFNGFGSANSDSKTDGNSSASFMNSLKDFDFSSIFGDDFDSKSFVDSYNSTASTDTDNEEQYADYEDHEYPNENDSETINDYTRSSDNSIAYESKDEDSMFEELKTMIPPEQMQTFENLRMLFGSASYDDSNKSNENKE